MVLEDFVSNDMKTISAAFIERYIINLYQ